MFENVGDLIYFAFDPLLSHSFGQHLIVFLQTEVFLKCFSTTSQVLFLLRGKKHSLKKWKVLGFEYIVLWNHGKKNFVLIEVNTFKEGLKVFTVYLRERGYNSAIIVDLRA